MMIKLAAYSSQNKKLYPNKYNKITKNPHGSPLHRPDPHIPESSFASTYDKTDCRTKLVQA